MEYGVETLTKTAWDALSEKQRWDVLVTMRGPDYLKGNLLKWYTTAVLRQRMKKLVRAKGGSAMTNSVLGFVIMPTESWSTKIKDFDLQHFLGHVYDAANILSIPMVHMPRETWIEIVLTAPTRTYSLQRLREFLLTLPTGVETTYANQVAQVVSKGLV